MSECSVEDLEEVIKGRKEDEQDTMGRYHGRKTSSEEMTMEKGKEFSQGREGSTPMLQ